MKYIHTKTQEQFDIVLTILNKKGWKKNSAIRDWSDYKNDTIIQYKDKFSVSSIYFAELCSSNTIITFEDFIIDNFDISILNKNNEPLSSLGWIPEKGEEYFIFDLGDICNFKNMFDSYDKKKFTYGHYFKTEKEANVFKQKQEYIQSIHVYMKENNLIFEELDWYNFEQYKYIITGWDYADDTVLLNQNCYINSSVHNFVFRSEKDMKQVLEKFEKELEFILKN